MGGGSPKGADAGMDRYYQQLAYNITVIIECVEDAIALGEVDGAIDAARGTG